MRPGRRNLIGTVFDPASLGNLELRLSGTTLDPGDDVLIASWADLSGHGRTATQGSDTPKPRTTIHGNSVVPDSPTNLKGAAFNFGENDNMTGAITFDFTQGMTAYAWINETVFGGANQTVWCPDNSSPALYFSGSTSKIGFGDADGEHASGTGAAGVSAFHSLVWVFYPPATGAGIAKVYLDGAEIQSTTWHITGSAAAYTLGNNQPLNSPFGGSQYEFLFYSAPHDLATITAVRAYGFSRWGI